MPLVSVIIPSYNAMDYIVQTLDSVINQTLEDIEIIVVDDGSTDSTREIVREYACRDERIELIEQSNQFAGVARNNGMAKAVGTYLYFLDADDFIESNALELLVHAIEASGTDIAIAKSEGFDHETGATWVFDGALSGMEFDCPIQQSKYCGTLFQSFIGWPWDKLFRKDLIDRTGLTFQALRTTNDALFVFCAMAQAESIVCLDAVLFHHRSNNKKSLEGSRDKSWNNALCAISSIENQLNCSLRGRACLGSFYRWVFNYSLWTIGTLSDAEADAYLNEIELIIRAIPQDTNLQLDAYENKFNELLDMNRAEMISSAIDLLRERNALEHEHEERVRSLENEVAQARERLLDVYSSHSYKLGHALLKPLSMMKDILGRK